MIITTLNELHKYLTHESFQLIDSFIKNIESNIADGIYPLKGDEIFAKVLSYETTVDNNEMVEAHNDYADIQILLAGEERINCYDRQKLKTRIAYSSEIDCEFFYPTETAKFATIQLKPGYFSILHPKDAHLAALHAENVVNQIKKIVIKTNEKFFI